MKVCPKCQARFTGGEAFCPHDGSKLVEARELSPGKLTGLPLDDLVNLEELELSDRLGERYRAKLIESGEWVRATTLNREFSPDEHARDAFESAIAEQDEAFPGSILAMQSYQLDTNPPFIIEDYPAGPSLRTLLEERKTLDWQTSVRIAANTARAAGYLVDRGILSPLLHPGSVFVTDLSTGSVQIGEWAHGLLSKHKSPLEAARANSESYSGYPGYIAPETIRDGDSFDQRSVIYVVGMLLYEMIVGKAPFTSKRAEDTLKRHLHEKPLKLSIARSGASLHPELDAVLDMMWPKAPERRFQNIGAVVGALSTLLDVEPSQLAPPLEPGPDTVGDGSTTKDSSADLEDPVEEAGETAMGLPTSAASTKDEDTAPKPQPSASDAQEDAEPDSEQAKPAQEQPSIIIDTSQLEPEEPANSATTASEEAPSSGHNDDAGDVPSPEQDDPETSVDIPSRQTLLLGDSAAQEDETLGLDPETSGDDRDADEVDTPEKQTLLMGADLSAKAAESSASNEADSADSSPEPESPAAHDPNPAEDDADVAQAAAADDDQTAEDHADEAHDDATKPEETDEAPSGKASQTDDPPSSDALEDQAQAPSDEAPPADAEDASEPSGMSLAIGSIEVDGSDLDMGDDWFGTSTEEAWETHQYQAVQAKSEDTIRRLTVGIIGMLVVGVIGFFLYVEFGTPTPDPSTNDTDTAQAQPERTNNTKKAPEVDEVDPDRLALLEENLESALKDGRFLSPSPNNALDALTELGEAAPKSANFARSRDAFVDAALARATELQADDPDAARRLAQAASRYSYGPRAQKIIDALNADERSASSRDQEDDDPTASAAKSVDPPRSASKKTSEPRRDPPRDARPSNPAAKTAPTPAPAPPAPSGPSIKSLLADAENAASRGDTTSAKKLFRQVLSKSASNAQALAALGDIYFDEASYSQSKTFFERASRANPGNTGILVDLGMSYFKLGEYKRAQSTWKAVLSRSPGNEKAQTYLNLVEKKLN